jgi:antitoxin MazE
MAHLIQIGNSQGVRIPKAIIAQANLDNKELEFKVTNDGLLIAPVKKAPREGWFDHIQQGVLQESAEFERETQEWLDAPLSDDSDWVW